MTKCAACARGPVGVEGHLDASYVRYEQRGDWRLGGHGSPGLAPFSAQWFEVGVACTF